MTSFILLAATSTENLDNYFRVLVLAVVAVIFGCLPLVIARLLRPKKLGEIKQAAFECGLESKGDPWVQFKIQYYVYALAFVIFDVEIIFLYPWAVAFGDVGMGGFIAMAIFIFLLAESLVYLWLKGILSWK
jgi:NADH-quinone oxidoreductase subunit A